MKTDHADVPTVKELKATARKLATRMNQLKREANAATERLRLAANARGYILGVIAARTGAEPMGE